MQCCKPIRDVSTDLLIDLVGLLCSAASQSVTSAVNQSVTSALISSSTRQVRATKHSSTTRIKYEWLRTSLCDQVGAALVAYWCIVMLEKR